MIPRSSPKSPRLSGSLKRPRTPPPCARVRRFRAQRCDLACWLLTLCLFAAASDYHLLWRAVLLLGTRARQLTCRVPSPGLLRQRRKGGEQGGRHAALRPRGRTVKPRRPRQHRAGARAGPWGGRRRPSGRCWRGETLPEGGQEGGGRTGGRGRGGGEGFDAVGAVDGVCRGGGGRRAGGRWSPPFAGACRGNTF